MMTRGMKKATKEPTSMKRSSFSTQLPFTKTLSLLLRPMTGIGMEIPEKQREREKERQRERERNRGKEKRGRALSGNIWSSLFSLLQSILNALAWLVQGLLKLSHVTPLPRSLHRLPVAAQITYKTLVLTFQASKSSASPHLRTKPHTHTTI
ncbi:hypothetical protein AOLI_G00107520 [Acnodon oligacanthus]